MPNNAHTQMTTAFINFKNSFPCSMISQYVMKLWAF